MPRQMTASTLDQDARADQDAQWDFGEWPEAFAVAEDGDAELLARPGLAEADHQVLVDDDLDDDEDEDIDDEDDEDVEDVEDVDEVGGDVQGSAADPDDEGLTEDDEDDDDFDDDDDEDEDEAEAEDEK